MNAVLKVFYNLFEVRFKVKKSALFLALSLFLIPCYAYSYNSPSILVFAGAGMREPLDEIGKEFTKIYNIEVVYDYEGSGRLGNKILAGQRPDIFIPGAERWAKLLKEKGHVKAYQAIAFHIPVIIAPFGSSKIVRLQDFLKKDVRLVTGDEMACAIGKATLQIFSSAGLDKAGMNIIAKGVTVKQLLFWIEQNNADAGIVWRADAVQSGKVKIVDIPIAINHIDIIPVCTMTKTKPKGIYGKTVLKYIKFLLNEGRVEFKKHGFKTDHEGL